MPFSLGSDILVKFSRQYGFKTLLTVGVNLELTITETTQTTSVTIAVYTVVQRILRRLPKLLQTFAS